MSTPTTRSIDKVVFTYNAEAPIVSAVRLALPGAKVVTYKDDDRVKAEIVDADLTIGGPISDELLDLAERLQWHHVPWVGVERAPAATLKSRNVLLTNASGINAIPIAEHIIGMMLMFARGLDHFVRSNERAEWRRPGRPDTFELTGQTVLVLGTGAIGQASATRLQPFGCTLVGARRKAGEVPGFDEVVTFDEVKRVFPTADHVVNTLPLTSHTEGIVSKSLLDSMKVGSCFFNVGRGGTVDQTALINLLQSGQLRGAGLDVCSPEPLPTDHLLWTTPNVLITDHTAGGSRLTAARSAELLTGAIKHFLAGEEIPTAVDLDFGY